MSLELSAQLRVLLVEDDRDLLNVTGMALNTAGYHVTCVVTGGEALSTIEREQFSLVILDVNIPAPNGVEVCRSIRQHSNVPVLMLSAGDREEDLLNALDAGADAYVTKPFSPRTLVARVHALIRRTPGEPRDITVRDFKLDPNDFLLRHRKHAIRLTRLETRLLRKLMANVGKTISADQLMAEAWGQQSAVNRNMLKQVIFRLRKKLLSYDVSPVPLGTEGAGYVWLDEVDASSAIIPVTITG